MPLPFKYDDPRVWQRDRHRLDGRQFSAAVDRGPARIRHQLRRETVEPLPGRSSVYRALLRHGLVDAQKRKRQRADYRRWERGRAMELWQTSDRGQRSTRGGGSGWPEGFRVVVGLARGQAVVKLAGEPVEQVPYAAACRSLMALRRS